MILLTNKHERKIFGIKKSADSRSLFALGALNLKNRSFEFCLLFAHENLKRFDVI
ncbi:hypothetical protein DES34_101729 [Brevibacillus brevis]|nr:hypothetical protein DES34_101729 [Brevibacillus brevis]GEC88546.1 hypothetical protein BBR01nite_08770 [Brevibacillus brevis]VEF88831.1 Uncharacterised protein [Brevibacillus brevis]